MGVAEGVPGVSGSTLALIMGIYEKFIDLLHSIPSAIKNVIKIQLKEKRLDLRTGLSEVNWGFGLPLLIGMVIALFGFSFVMDAALESIPQYVYAFFFWAHLGLTPNSFFKDEAAKASRVTDIHGNICWGTLIIQLTAN